MLDGCTQFKMPLRPAKGAPGEKSFAEVYAMVLDKMNMVFTACFTVECILKSTATGVRVSRVHVARPPNSNLKLKLKLKLW